MTMLRHLTRTLLSLTAFLSLTSASPAHAEQTRRVLGIDAIAGFPSLLGIGIQYMGLKSFEFGVGFGSAPVNNVLQKSAGLEPRSIDLGLADSYTIAPLSRFNLTSFTPFVRYYPWDGALFFELAYSVQRAGASVSGDLTNTTTGAVTSGVMSGSLKFTQVTPGVMFGYRPFIADNVFLSIAGGFSWVQSVGYELGIGGSLANVAGLTPSGAAEFEQFKSDIRSAIDEALSEYRSNVKFLPSVRFSLGIAF